MVGRGTNAAGWGAEFCMMGGRDVFSLSLAPTACPFVVVVRCPSFRRSSSIARRPSLSRFFKPYTLPLVLLFMHAHYFHISSLILLSFIISGWFFVCEGMSESEWRFRKLVL